VVAVGEGAARSTTVSETAGQPAAAVFVQNTLQQATRAIKVIAVQNIQSRDPTEERWCMGQVITASGSFKTVAFTLR
jgi:hypothetical protein